MAGSVYWWARPEVRARIAERVLAGASPSALAAEYECSRTTIWRIGNQAVRLRRRAGQSRLRLSFEERERVLIGVSRGESDAEIARALGRHRSTIGREIKRTCADRWRYRPSAAERRSHVRARRPKPRKLSGSGRLLEAVEAGLEAGWSPEQISARLKLDHPDDLEMRISHETIYRSLFVQSRGELRRELCASLRTGRTHRRPRGKPETRGRIIDMVMISERPAEVEDRAVPGHWEGDLLMGSANRSQVATLVERQTRFVMLAALADKTAPNVARVLAERIQALPQELRRSLTWDQGSELSEHKAFTIESGVPVYFCDPRSPWQRGSNENTNGLLRQYLPKNVDLSGRTQAELDAIAAQLNGRPRKTLEWRTPAEKLAELLA